MSEEFDSAMGSLLENSLNPIRWVNWEGEPLWTGLGSTVVYNQEKVSRVSRGHQLGDPSELLFRDPASFRAGELHKHVAEWMEMIGDNPRAKQKEVLGWIQKKASIFPYFKAFSGSFKGEYYRSPDHRLDNL